MSATAYSYVRFSSPEQAKGDSLRRQHAARDAWLTAHPDVKLDESLKMTDAGRSGFDRTNWHTYALNQFVAYVKSGRVAKGSFLLVENLDRLSRENAGDATELFLSIVNKGITIVQLSPVAMEFAKPVQMMSLMYAIMELSRGHSESAIKSERGQAVWKRKQKEASADKITTKKLPGWIRVSGGKLVLDTAKAAVVRRIFALALEGHGALAIAQRLNEDKVPLMGRTLFKGRAVRWANTTVYYVLTSRACIGEYIPYRASSRSRNDRTEGTPVAGYFPAVVPSETFYAVQAALRTRATVGRGRRGKHVNLFAGLLKDARTGGSLGYRLWNSGKEGNVTPIDARQGRDTATRFSYPAKLLDDALLSQLSEVTAADVEGNGTDHTKRVEQLSGELKGVEKLIATWTAKMDDVDNVDRVANKLNELDAKHRKLSGELEAAQREASSPIAEAVGAMKSLLELLKKDNSDDMRTRVRAAIRRVVESVSLFVVEPLDSKGERVGVVQIQYPGSGRRRLCFITATGAASKRDDWENIDIRTETGRGTVTAIVLCRAEEPVRETTPQAEHKPIQLKSTEHKILQFPSDNATIKEQNAIIRKALKKPKA